MEPKTLARYSVPAQALHWLTAILVLVAFFYGQGGTEAQVYSAAQDFERQLHETLGLGVLALTALRLLWRAVDQHPEPPPLARWIRVSAGVVQAGLYVLLLAVPLTAISGAWLEGHPLTLLPGVTVVPPWAESHALGATIAEVHTWLGDAILWLAGVHAAAGLFHHHVLKDGVLRSMLPGWAAGNR
ncbi:MAG: cytochrome b [Burkholderiales bacterium]|nr:cytochrome b [Burkholderiales bacterium]